jgi:hypothetical protein
MLEGMASCSGERSVNRFLRKFLDRQLRKRRSSLLARIELLAPPNPSFLARLETHRQLLEFASDSVLTWPC